MSTRSRRSCVCVSVCVLCAQGGAGTEGGLNQGGKSGAQGLVHMCVMRGCESKQAGRIRSGSKERRNAVPSCVLGGCVFSASHRITAVRGAWSARLITGVGGGRAAGAAATPSDAQRRPAVNQAVTSAQQAAAVRGSPFTSLGRAAAAQHSAARAGAAAARSRARAELACAVRAGLAVCCVLGLPASVLCHGDALGQVARLVHVEAPVCNCVLCVGVCACLSVWSVSGWAVLFRQETPAALLHIEATTARFPCTHTLTHITHKSGTQLTSVW